MHGWAKTLALGFGILGALGACEIGDGGDGGGDGEDLFARIAGGPDDSRLDALEIVCETTLIVSGTHTPDPNSPAPDSNTGCWEVGDWTVNSIQVDFQGCSPDPVYLDSYTYRATRTGEDAENAEVVYQDDLDFERVNLKVTTAGDGLCHGSFSIFYEDLTEITFNPTLNADGTLSGDGAFRYHTEDPY